MSDKEPSEYRNAIYESGMDIYSPIEVGDPEYWIPTVALTSLLNDNLRGLSLVGLPLRTRSKVVKSAVCDALGYPVPATFKKTKPRFLGQQLDTYAQKSLNLQIWNEELSPARRYAIIQVKDDDTIGSVRVINGQELALFDTTGTITTKYQARIELQAQSQELISPQDTLPMQSHVRVNVDLRKSATPTAEPVSGELLTTSAIFERLSPLIGYAFQDPGADQERNRGAALHRLVCQRLGYLEFGDKGRFPDVRHQLLEIKLQTSPTIDLGLVLPSSEDLLDIRQLGSYHPRHCDTRYVIFYGVTNGATVTLTHIYVVTGADFFNRFRRFEGKIINGKIQIRLTRDFFDS